MKSEEIKQVSFDKGSRRASVTKKTQTEADQIREKNNKFKPQRDFTPT